MVSSNFRGASAWTAKIFGNRNDNTPVRVRFKILKTENLGLLRVDQLWVAYDQNTQLQSHKTRYNGWVVPRNSTVAINPTLNSEVGGMEVHTVYPIALPGSDKQNQNTQDITVMQATMTISNDYFITKTGNAPTGSVSIQDNVGHYQTLRVTCSSTDGKPVVTG